MAVLCKTTQHKGSNPEASSIPGICSTTGATLGPLSAIFVVFLFWLDNGATPGHAQSFLLTLLRERYMVPEIEPKPAACRARATPTVIAPAPLSGLFTANTTQDPTSHGKHADKIVPAEQNTHNIQLMENKIQRAFFPPRLS